MSNMNFFGWIREGVRQSVLLGVSDAVEQLGTPATVEELHSGVAGFLKLETRTVQPQQPQPSPSLPGSKSRKRLGKSLKDFGTGAP